MSIRRVAIVGAGPAGIAAAEYLAKSSPEVEIVIFEKGRSAPSRICPIDWGRACRGCQGSCNVTSGFGGCLQYGDAIKLSRFPAGRRLGALLGDYYCELESEALALFGVHGEEFSPQAEIPLWEGVRVRSYPVAEIGEARLALTLLEKYEFLSRRCDVRMSTRVLEILRISQGFVVISQGVGGKAVVQDCVDAVLIAVGRSGIADMTNWLDTAGIESKPAKLSVGVRFEMPAYLLSPLYKIHKDFKYTERRQGLKIKSFCFSAHPESGGMIKYCHYQDQFDKEVIFLDAHTNVDRASCSGPVGNFALLAQVEIDGSAREWINSSLVPLYSARYAGQPIWQPLAELVDGFAVRPDVRPSVASLQRGIIGEIIPLEMLREILGSYESLVRLAGEIGGYDTGLFYESVAILAPAVEFAWDTIDVTSSFETSVDNFFVLGDCAGLAQGVLQSAISGLAASKELVGRGILGSATERIPRSLTGNLSPVVIR